VPRSHSSDVASIPSPHTPLQSTSIPEQIPEKQALEVVQLSPSSQAVLLATNESAGQDDVVPVQYQVV
jgi:hypothetical protein